MKPLTRSQEELDSTLNTVLPADSLERMHGLCTIAGQSYNRDGEAVMRIMWGLAMRVSYTDYEAGPTRMSRSPDVSFADIQMIKWATSGKSTDVRRRKGPADPEYMAKVLGHPLAVAEKLWNEYGPAKGRAGFQLHSKTIT